MHALVSAYEAAGGPGRVTRAEDFGLTIAQLHHIGRYQVLGWLNARDPEARARAHAGVAEFVDDPFRHADVERLLGWLRSKPGDSARGSRVGSTGSLSRLGGLACPPHSPTISSPSNTT